jgi:hypothetical protein
MKRLFIREPSESPGACLPMTQGDQAAFSLSAAEEAM